MDIYIAAASSISPQDTFNKTALPESLIEYQGKLKNVLPDFTKYYKSIQLRRTNNYIKAGVACGLETLELAGIEKPDAIISATSLGSVSETEKLLNQMLDTNEGLLSPTPFIQSTHNIIGAQIAEKIQCNGYNVLYAHHTTSFENALLDAVLQLKENQLQSVLVGGFDELTEENYRLKQHVSIYKNESCSNFDLLQTKTQGSIAGEGTAYFLVTNQQPASTSTQLRWLNSLNKATVQDSCKWLSDQLQLSGLNVEDIDLVISGKNGDSSGDDFYTEVMKNTFPSLPTAYYKHLCGEYDTASAFALWTANSLLTSGICPSYVLENASPSKLENIIIYHQHQGRDQSVMVLSLKKGV